MERQPEQALPPLLMIGDVRKVPVSRPLWRIGSALCCTTSGRSGPAPGHEERVAQLPTARRARNPPAWASWLGAWAAPRMRRRRRSAPRAAAASTAQNSTIAATMRRTLLPKTLSAALVPRPGPRMGPGG
jgi:hypothetical protein